MVMLQNVNDEAAVTQAIEDNIAEFLLAMGRAGGGEEHHSAKITWTIGGSPIDYHNAVVHAKLTSDSAIGEVIERFRMHNVPGTWHLAPSMQPDDLAARLESRGFQNGGDEAGMAAYLPDLNQATTTPDDFSVTRVVNADDVATWEKTLASGFGEGEREARWVADVYSKIGFGDDIAWRHFIGWLGDEPVATTSMYLGAGVVGIYFVFTVPTARRMGIGGAITLAALNNAHYGWGYKVGVLGSSTMGLPVYQRLGFRKYCDFHIYEWHG